MPTQTPNQGGRGALTAAPLARARRSPSRPRGRGPRALDTHVLRGRMALLSHGEIRYPRACESDICARLSRVCRSVWLTFATRSPRKVTSRLTRRRSRIRATRRRDRPPSDADIERGLRERAVTDPRAAEILLRWLQRPRPVAPETDALEALSTEQLERLHKGLIALCSMDPEVQAGVINRLIAGVDVSSVDNAS